MRETTLYGKEGKKRPFGQAPVKVPLKRFSSKTVLVPQRRQICNSESFVLIDGYCAKSVVSLAYNPSTWCGSVRPHHNFPSQLSENHSPSVMVCTDAGQLFGKRDLKGFHGVHHVKLAVYFISTELLRFSCKV